MKKSGVVVLGGVTAAVYFAGTIYAPANPPADAPPAAALFVASTSMEATDHFVVNSLTDEIIFPSAGLQDLKSVTARSS